MKQTLLLLFCLTLASTALAQREATNLALTNPPTLGAPIWVADIGITTFRNNMMFVDGNVYVGSNGTTRDEKIDPADGVYAIDGKTGKIVAQYGNQTDSKIKDADVCGLYADDEVLVFGNDAGQFFQYDRVSKKVNWQKQLAGHFEGVPAAAQLNDDDQLDFVAAVKSEKEDYFLRNGVLYAFDGRNGDILWKFTAPDQGVFMGSPALADLNDDNIKDAIIGNGLSGGYLYAVNGKDGSLLWKFNAGTGIHSSPFVFTTDDGAKRIFFTESYSGLIGLTAEGEPRLRMNLNCPDGGITGLFSSPIIAHNGRMIIASSWWGDDDLIYTIDPQGEGTKQVELEDNVHMLTATEEAADMVPTHARVSATPIYFEANDGQRYFMVPAEDGKIYTINVKSGDYTFLEVPGSVEASLFMADVNNDRQAELLVATREGKLYCYTVGIPVGGKRSQIFWNGFRGNRHNTGEAGYAIGK